MTIRHRLHRFRCCVKCEACIVFRAYRRCAYGDTNENTVKFLNDRKIRGSLFSTAPCTLNVPGICPVNCNPYLLR
jgi:hypothetical protein